MYWRSSQPSTIMRLVCRACDKCNFAHHWRQRYSSIGPYISGHMSWRREVHEPLEPMVVRHHEAVGSHKLWLAQDSKALAPMVCQHRRPRSGSMSRHREVHNCLKAVQTTWVQLGAWWNAPSRILVTPLQKHIWLLIFDRQQITVTLARAIAEMPLPLARSPCALAAMPCP